MKRHNLLLTLLSLSFPLLILSQKEHSARLEHGISPAKELTLKSNASALMPQLTPLSLTNRNAPKPFIKHFWELGDGNYSLDERPQHAFLKPDKQKVRLSLIPCYSPDKIKLDSQTIDMPAANMVLAAKSLGNTLSGNLLMASSLSLNNINVVRANEPFVGVVSFRNSLLEKRHARIYVFFNKKEQVRNVGRVIQIKDMRLHKATEISTGSESGELNKLKNDYYDTRVFRINDVGKDIQNLFFTLVVAANAQLSQLKDLDIHAAMVFDGTPSVEQSILTFKIATSFDPNNIEAPGLMSFRWVKNKKFTYRINFENIGNAPAHSITLKMDLPDALDPLTISDITTHPKAMFNNSDSNVIKTVSADGKTLTFTLSNLILNGAKEVWNPKKKDTQGYISFAIKPKSSIRKKPIETKATIIFDNNEPIVTDPDRTTFRRGHSIGLKTGVNWQPQTGGFNYFVGATYSAFRPAEPYLQMEIMADLNRRTVINDSATLQYRGIKYPRENTSYTGVKDSFSFTERYAQTNAFRLVPAQVRYDFPRFMSLGIGLFADVAMLKERQFATRTELKYFSQTPVPETCLYGRTLISSINRTQIDFGLFGDVSLGKYSNGFALGFRYMQPLKKGQDSFGQLYVSYKLL